MFGWMCWWSMVSTLLLYICISSMDLKVPEISVHSTTHASSSIINVRIMKPEYLGKCLEAGKFLDEEPFEWGYGLNNNGSNDSNDRNRILGLENAGKRWRERIAQDQLPGNPFFAVTHLHFRRVSFKFN